MLSNPTVNVLGQYYKFSYLIGASPYEWNATTKRVKFTTNRFHLYLWYAGLVWTTFYPIFITFRLIYAVLYGYNGKNVLIAVIAYDLFFVLCWSIVWVFNLNTWLYKSEIECYINHIIGSSETFKKLIKSANLHDENKKPKSENVMDLCGKAMLALRRMADSFCIGIFFAMPALPNNPIYPYSLFDAFVVDSKQSRWRLIPWGLFEIVVTFLGAYVLMFYVVTFYANVFSMMETLKRMKYKSYAGISKSTFTVLYRQLQLLNSSYNVSLRKLILPLFLLILFLCSLICNFGTVRMYEALGIPAYFMMPLMSVIQIGISSLIYTTCANIGVMSYDALQSWKIVTHQEVWSLERRKSDPCCGKYFHCFLKACQPLEICIGEFFLVTSTTTLNYFSTVWDNTINSLLTF